MSLRSIRREIREFPRENLRLESGRKMSRHLLKMEALAKAREPPNEFPTYHLSWSNTIAKLNQSQMRAVYRMDHSTFKHLYSLLSAHMHEKEKTHFKRQLAAVLHYLGNPTLFPIDRNVYGVSRDNLDRWVVSVCKTIVDVLGDTIKFPREQDGSAQALAARIEEEYGIPGVVGIIGSSLIKLGESTNEDDPYFAQSNGFSGYHLQATCDDQMVFTDVWIGDHGSKNASSVWDNSTLSRWLPLFLPSNDFHLLGDSAYPLSIRVPPYEGELNKAQASFNEAHKKATQILERAFSLLKNRWRILRNMPLDLPNVQPVTYACCLLHNFCIISGELFEEDDDTSKVRKRPLFD